MKPSLFFAHHRDHVQIHRAGQHHTMIVVGSGCRRSPCGQEQSTAPPHGLCHSKARTAPVPECSAPSAFPAPFSSAAYSRVKKPDHSGLHECGQSTAEPCHCSLHLSLPGGLRAAMHNLLLVFLMGSPASPIGFSRHSAQKCCLLHCATCEVPYFFENPLSNLFPLYQVF